MLYIDIEDVPDFLKKSKLYKTFLENLKNEKESSDGSGSEDNEMETISTKIPVNEKHFIKSPNIENGEDLKRLIEVMRYWMVDDVPDEIYDAILDLKIEGVDLEEFSDFPSIKSLRALVKKFGCMFLIKEAAKIGSLKVMKYAHSRNYFVAEEAFVFSAKNGHYECLKYLFQISNKWKNNKTLICLIAKQGYADLLKICIEDRKNTFGLNYWNKYYDNVIGETTMLQALLGGNLECVELLHDYGIPIQRHSYGLFHISSVDACRIAAENGHLDILKYGISKGLTVSSSLLNSAVKNGHLNIIKFIKENYQVDFSDFICYLAIKNNQDECFKWCFDNGATISDNCFNVILEKERLDLIRYIHEKGFSFGNKHLVIAKQTDDKSHQYILKLISDTNTDKTKNINKQEIETLINKV